MRQTPADSPRPQWQVLSTCIRHRDGPRRVEQAFRLLLGTARPPEAFNPPEGRSDHASSDLRPRLDQPPGARPDD
jgi:hypothetical protein